MFGGSRSTASVQGIGSVGTWGMEERGIGTRHKRIGRDARAEKRGMMG